MFKTFPKFSKLTFEDRTKYERFIKKYPPLNDLSFVTLMTMWSTLDTAQVAVLNSNLVISYWLPGDDKRSGLSLIGTNKIDESLCIIFDHLRNSGRDARIVNIPQFVVDHIRYPEIFNFDFMSGDEEYVLALKRYTLLEELPFYQRARIKKFVKKSGNLEVRALDPGLAQNRRLFLDKAADWPRRGLNNIGKFEEEAMNLYLRHARELSVKSICLFEDGELIAYNLYHPLTQPKYIVIAHSRLDYSMPYIFDYMAYKFSAWWLENGFDFANIHNDMGVLGLRALQISLRPVELFRKYTVEPF
jgi:hypothetical protein